MEDTIVQDLEYDKIDIMSFNKNWNDNNERLVVSIGENAASYKWMHEQSSMFYNAIHKALGILLIFFNTALSTQTIVTDSSNNTFTKSFIYLATILSVLQNFLNYEKIRIEHQSCASEFSKLYHDIQVQMSKYRKNRLDANDYVSEVITRLDTLIVGGPNIAYIAVWRFKKVFNNSEISLPDIADKIQRIEIISESPKQIGQINKTLTTPPVRSDSLPIQQQPQPRDTSKQLTRLDEISKHFRIQGDITDEEIQMKRLQRQARLKYEEDRYNKHKQSD